MFLRDSRIILLPVCIIIVLDVLLLTFIVSIACSALTIAIFLLDYLSICRGVCVHLMGHFIIYIGCRRRNVPDFGRVFLMLKYTDITQNTDVQSGTYGDNGRRIVWSSRGSTHCTCQLTSLIDVCP